MSELSKDSRIWVSHTGITFVFRVSWWMPFKKLQAKFIMYMIDNLELVTKYDAEAGTTGDIKERVWAKETYVNGVRIK